MTYKLAIYCNECGKTSYNSNDVAKKYCSVCAKFHHRKDNCPSSEEKEILEQIEQKLKELNDSFSNHKVVHNDRYHVKISKKASVL